MKCPACGVDAPPDEAPSNPFELSGDTRPLPDPLAVPPAPDPDPPSTPSGRSGTSSSPEPEQLASDFEPEDEPEAKPVDPEPQPGDVGYSPQRGDTVRIPMSDVVAAWNEDAAEPNAPPPTPPSDAAPIAVPNIKLRVIAMIIVIAGLVALGAILMR